MLGRYYQYICNWITAEKIKKHNVNLEETFKRLSNVSLNFPKVASKIKVGLAEVDSNEEEEKKFSQLTKNLKILVLKLIKRKMDNNRIVGEDFTELCHYIIGCNHENNY